MKWECPKCGCKKVQGMDPEMIAKRNSLGMIYYVAVPTKFWCMVCLKEYPVVIREVVQFT